jgi:hypothetical protein
MRDLAGKWEQLNPRLLPRHPDPIARREDRVMSYDEINRGEMEYKGFQLRRDPDFCLWSISKDGRTVSPQYGVVLHGRYTRINIAQDRIDEYLSRKEEYEKAQRENNQTPN